jgi:hypothetical protein
MKNILTILITTFFINAYPATNVSLNYNEDYPKVAKIITKLIGEMTIDEQFNSDLVFEIILTINSENRIIVLEVNTHINSIKRNVKNVLNNKLLSVDDLIIGKEYTFPVTIKGEN